MIRRLWSKIFPSCNFYMQTDKSAEEVREILQENVEIHTLWKAQIVPLKLFMDYKVKPFYGYLEGNTFKFSKMQVNQNPALPWVTGSFFEKNGKTVVTARTGIYPTTQIFFTCIVAFLLLISLLELLKGNFEVLFAVFPFLAFIFLGVYLAKKSFWKKVQELEPILMELFHAKT